MRRETRANLIFLVIFLAISLPGAVILFRKKLDPTAPRMDLPDPVVHRLPFMVPPPNPPGMKWFVPDLTRQWLGELTETKMHQPMASAAAPGPQWEPVISDDHRLQIMALAPADKPVRIGLLLWNGHPQPDAKLFSVTVNQQPVRVTSVEYLTVPPKVRRELVIQGYTKPPMQVTWIEVEMAHPLASGSGLELGLSYSGPPAAFQIHLEK